MMLSLGLYFVIARALESTAIKIPTAATIVVLIPYLLQICIQWIMAPGSRLLDQVTVVGMVVVVVQIAVAAASFMVLRQKEEQIVAWWGIAFATGMSIFLLVPTIIRNILG